MTNFRFQTRKVATIVACLAVTVMFSSCKDKEDKIFDLNGTVTISPTVDVFTGTELTAAYSGAETVAWQWNKDGTTVSGATAAKYTPTEAGSYTATASAPGYNSKTSAAVEVKNFQNLNGTVTISPADDVFTGDELTAAYSGSETITWQWNKDGTAINDAINNKYIPAEAGSYTVTANATGYNSKTSAAVEVKIAQNQITMTTATVGDFIIYLAGTGETTINWGDGATETITSYNYGTYHTYVSAGAKTITITGDIISLTTDYQEVTAINVSKMPTLEELSCNNNQLTVLDVSKNIALKGLYCNDNQLTSLDVSKNTVLEHLLCGANQLISLDVSKNTALTVLHCYFNQLTLLNITGCNELYEIHCQGNALNLSALTNIFTALPEGIGSDSHIIYIYRNPGIDEDGYAAAKTIATVKNWLVGDIDD